jgi:hypothetical protein
MQRSSKRKTRLPATINAKPECPRWDSNPHWTGFESVSSASWDTRAFGCSEFGLPP